MQTLMWRCGCSGWVSPPLLPVLCWGTWMGRCPTQPHIHPEDGSSHATPTPWVPGLVQAALCPTGSCQTSSRQGWGCQQEIPGSAQQVTAPDPTSPSTLWFYTAFQADSFVSKVFLQFLGFIWLMVSWSSSLALWVWDKHSGDFGCPSPHTCIPVISCYFQEHVPGKHTLTQCYCTV